MSNNPHAINVYTDGSTYGNPGPSGQGIVIVYPDGEVKELSKDGYSHSTINRTELRACIDALIFIQKDDKSKAINQVCIYSDSQYVVDNYMNAVSGFWQKCKWKKKDGHDIDNQDLWKLFIREFGKVKKRIEIFKVKAHSGNKYNDIADSLAKKSRKRAIRTDFGSKKTQVRRWLPIKENKSEVNLSRVLKVYIQRIDARKSMFDIFMQVLTPKKYIGAKISATGAISVHKVRAGHIFKIKLRQSSGGRSLFIDRVIEDLGTPTENGNLWK